MNGRRNMDCPKVSPAVAGRFRGASGKRLLKTRWKHYDMNKKH
jgi:hypothetical protein